MSAGSLNHENTSGMPMQLLWVKAGRLLPVDTGGKLRSYHLARTLAKKHRVTMLTYYSGPRDSAYESEMEAHFPGSITMRTGPRTAGRVVDALRYAGSVMAEAPFAVGKFASPEVEALVTEWSRTGRFDAMICDFLSASLNFRRASGAPAILFQHNVESALWERQARHASGRVLRIIYGFEARKMKRYESDALRRFAHVIAVSDHDKQLMTEMRAGSRITVVPTGVDAMHFEKAAAREPVAPVVLFLGSMDWEANADGVTWMCDEIWPRIQRAVPKAVFRIVGRNPPARVRRLAGPSVEVTGSVPSVEPYLSEAAAFVVPLRIGGGTRLKIFEAMASGRAVVSTSVGAEGLPVTSGRNILIADEAGSFADAVVRVLTDHQLRQSIALDGLRLAREHDWSAVAAGFEVVVREACEAKSQGSGPGTEG